MRKAIVAGQFYPDKKEILEKEMDKYLKKESDGTIKAAIAPHAGYLFSGRIAGKVYSKIPRAETYIIVGVNHQGTGEDVAVSLEQFETPLGIVGNDVELGEEILRELQVYEDEDAHQMEHSIEVQLPFLQSVYENPHIVPILLKNHDLDKCKKLAKAIINSSNKLNRKIILIASSDLTHTGPAYDFSGSIEVDKEAIDKILNLDSEGFLGIADKTTICGAGAILTIMEASKLMNASKAELLEYYDSSSILDNENKVGYAGIVFR